MYEDGGDDETQGCYEGSEGARHDVDLYGYLPSGRYQGYQQGRERRCCQTSHELGITIWFEQSCVSSALYNNLLSSSY